MSPRLRVVALAVVLTGCTRWVPYQTQATPAPDLPRTVRVWSAGGEAAELTEPFVKGDTLYGRARDDTLGVAIARIDSIARPRVDGRKTAGVVVASLAGWIALGVAGGGLE